MAAGSGSELASAVGGLRATFAASSARIPEPPAWVLVNDPRGRRPSERRRKKDRVPGQSLGLLSGIRRPHVYPPCPGRNSSGPGFWGVALGYIIRLAASGQPLESVEALSQKMVDEARREAETLKKEALLAGQGPALSDEAGAGGREQGAPRRAELSWEKRLDKKEESLWTARAPTLDSSASGELHKRETELDKMRTEAAERLSEYEQSWWPRKRPPWSASRP